LSTIVDIIKKTEAYMCQDCGKCSSVCPISRLNSGYSPRRMVTNSISKEEKEIISNKAIWNCLTCGRCLEVCPQGIDYMELTKGFRSIAYKSGEKTVCSHGGAFQSLMRIMTSETLKQNRMGWIPKTAKIKDKGDILFFIGCLPYFDVFFADLGVKTIDSAKSTLKLLNKVGIEPVILPNERCCGHDLLWGGDMDGFLKLAKHNIKAIKDAGAKKVIFSCAEGYRTFKIDYEQYIGPLDFEVEHISTFLLPYVEEGKLTFKNFNKKVTYQDPCRLGRHMGIYEEPRKLLESVPKLELVEMNKNRENAICCGTNAWLNCDIFSKKMQRNKLSNAEENGAEILTVACPKCEIHLRCAMNEFKGESDGAPDIDIKYFATILNESIQ
jgi:heterodisulfide reductase subunit D